MMLISGIIVVFCCISVSMCIAHKSGMVDVVYGAGNYEEA